MRSRLFSPLRIVILLFAGAAVLIVLVAVYQARRGPLMQQEMARAKEVGEVLERMRHSDGAPAAEAGGAKNAAKGVSNAPILDALAEFAKQLEERFPYYVDLTRSPSQFPKYEIEGLTQNTASDRSFLDGEKKWLDDYDHGRLRLPVFAEMTESERKDWRARRQQRVDAAEKSLEAHEALLDRMQNNPESLWKNLLDYFENASVLHEVEERLRRSPKGLPPELGGAANWFYCRAILETHAGQYDAALTSYDAACTLGRLHANAGNIHGTIWGHEHFLTYLVDRGPLNTEQRARLMNQLSASSDVAPAAGGLRDILRGMAATVEGPLDRAEMAQLKLDSAGATAYRSPFEIANQAAAALDKSLDEGLQVLMAARDDLRTISGTPYASASPSLFGPKGRIVRYVGYVTNYAAEAAPNNDTPPTLLSTAKFVDQAIASVESLMEVVGEADVVRTALAVKDYRSAKGHYPARLKDVTPEFLASIPIVPGTGKPLAYAAPESRSGATFILISEPVTPHGPSRVVWQAWE